MEYIMEIEMIEFGSLPDFSIDEKHSMLIDFLKDNICTVKFKKINGDERVMNCTLAKQYLPESYQESQAINDIKTSIPVYLPQEQCWRSFRVDNVISLTVNE